MSALMGFVPQKRGMRLARFIVLVGATLPGLFACIGVPVQRRVVENIVATGGAPPTR
jgi:hypothetical protein